MEKIIPKFSEEYLKTLIKNTPIEYLPIHEDQTDDEFIQKLTPIIFDPQLDGKRVVLEDGKDIIKESANNYYKGDISQKEVEEYYAKKNENNPDNISYGLNTQLEKNQDGKLIENLWYENGLYDKAIKQIVNWLEMAEKYAENALQKSAISKLIKFYKTGNLKKFDEYSITWVTDIASEIDFINGFIEVYGDPLAIKGSWESVVHIKNEKASVRTNILSKNAQWFEDHSPVDNRFKKKEVKGVSAKVVDVAMVGGDCFPACPIGINLPNAEWIREQFGSKSITIDNITYAHHVAMMHNGMLQEFAYNQEEIERAQEFGFLGGNLHTDLHECLGHGSGQLLEGVAADALKNYHSTIEETRADLFALYYVMDRKMIELGLFDNADLAKAEYDSYIRNGLMTQLTRIELGKDIEESHMRNRQLIAKWCYEKGKEEKVIEKIIKDNKTYFVINDYYKLRQLFSDLLIEIQRIKSEGDFEAAKNIIEKYAVKIDLELHKEVLERFKKLNIAPYAGFINPEYKPIISGDAIVDIEINYPSDFTTQMIKYSTHYSYLDGEFI